MADNRKTSGSRSRGNGSTSGGTNARRNIPVRNPDRDPKPVDLSEAKSPSTAKQEAFPKKKSGSTRPTKPAREPQRLRMKSKNLEEEIAHKKLEIRTNLMEMMDKDKESYAVLSKIKPSNTAERPKMLITPMVHPALVIPPQPTSQPPPTPQLDDEEGYLTKVSATLDAVKQYIDEAVPPPAEEDRCPSAEVDGSMDGDDTRTSPRSDGPEVPDFDVDEDMLELSTKLFPKKDKKKMKMHQTQQPQLQSGPSTSTSLNAMEKPVSLKRVESDRLFAHSRKTQPVSSTVKLPPKKVRAAVTDLPEGLFEPPKQRRSLSDGQSKSREAIESVPELEEKSNIPQEKTNGLKSASSNGEGLDYLIKEPKSGSGQSKESIEMEVLVRKAIEVCLMNSKMSDLLPEAMKIFHDKKSYPVENLANAQFTRIRKIFNVSEREIVKSICMNGPLSGGVSKGKSGQFFFATSDKKFVLKTLTKEEFDFLSGQFVLEYASYMAKHKNSLLPRFYAAIKLSYGLIPKDYRFIIMNNVFGSNLKIHEVYDLKGSKIGREASKLEPSILKENDLLKRKRQFYFSAELLLGLYLQLTEDIQFLSNNKIMDYSLLVGVHIIDENSPLSNPDYKQEEDDGTLYRSMFQKEHGGMFARSKDGEPLAEIYYFGVIDILQEYNFRKNFESIIMGSIYSSNAISAVDPEHYSSRFLGFVFKNVVKFESSKKILP